MASASRPPTTWERSTSLLGPRGNARFLDVDGPRVRYVGPGASDKDAASVRTDAPVPKTVGVFYWEVTVVSTGRDGFIGELWKLGMEKRQRTVSAGAGCEAGRAVNAGLLCVRVCVGWVVAGPRGAGERGCAGGGRAGAPRWRRLPPKKPHPPRHASLPTPPPGVGFAGPDVKLDRLPGWDAHSYGYHGDDGHAFRGSGTGRPYGPRYGAGDVIGLLLNRAEGTISFTKNGVDLGVAFERVTEARLYPCVGLRTPGEEIIATLTPPFSVDAAALLADACDRATARAVAAGAKRDGGASTTTTKAAASFAARLALDHLRHVGARRAAAALAADAFPNGCAGGVGIDDDQDASPDAARAASARAAARAAVVRGDIASARASAEAAAPGAISSTPALDFALDVRAFVELVRARDDDGAMAHGAARLTRARAVAAGGEAAVDALADALSLLAYMDPSASPAGGLLSAGAAAAVAADLDACLRSAAGLPPASALEAVVRQALAARAELVAGGDAEAALVDVARACGFGDA